MTIKPRSLGVTALCVAVLGLAGCGSPLENALESAVILTTAAIPLECTSTSTAVCLYLQAVNQDAINSLPIAENTTLTVAQAAAQLLPLWTNVVNATFPNEPVTVAAVVAGVSVVVQLIQQYAGPAQARTVAIRDKKLSMSLSDGLKIQKKASANLALIKSTMALRR